MSKPIFLTDLDDVMTEGGYLYLMNELLGTNLTAVDLEGIYYIEDIVESMEVRKQIHKYWIEKNVYKYSTFVNGVQECLKKISEICEVYVCSSPYFPLASCEYLSKVYAQKFNFVTQNFPFIHPKNIIFMDNKSLFNSKVKFQLDDRIENLNSDACHKLLFKSNHNKDWFKTSERKNNNSIFSFYGNPGTKHADVLRCENWDDVLYLVKKL